MISQKITSCGNLCSFLLYRRKDRKIDSSKKTGAATGSPATINEAYIGAVRSKAPRGVLRNAMKWATIPAALNDIPGNSGIRKKPARNPIKINNGGTNSL